MGYVQEESRRAVGRRWAVTFAVIGGLLAAYVIAALVGSFWPFSVARNLVQKVTSAESIIGNYEWFYDMKGQIDATRNKAKIAAGTQEEKGIRMVLESMIAEYNAKSRMITRNLWKAGDLPYEIKSEE